MFLHDDAQSILGAAIAASHPRGAVATSAQLRTAVASAAAAGCTKVAVLAVGKAAASMARGVQDCLQTSTLSQLPSFTLLITKHGHLEGVAPQEAGAHRLVAFEAGHPTPDAAGERGARYVMDTWVPWIDDSTLVVACISGGASALLPLPAPPLCLSDLVAVNDALLGAGADIREINTVRKHLSAISGGRLGLAIRGRSPAAAACCVLSDVVGDALDVIASGPVVPDPSTFQDALAVLTKYKLAVEGVEGAVVAAAPPLAPAVALLHAGASARGMHGAAAPSETPKPLPAPALPSSGYWAGLSPCELPCEVVGSNAVSLRAAVAAAAARGFSPVLTWPLHSGGPPPFLEGEAAPAAIAFAQQAWELSERPSTQQGSRGLCLLGGGETTVTLHAGAGRGGRNQEFALAAAVRLLQLSVERGASLTWAVGSVGTDGTDGPTPAAGALLSSHTIASGWGSGDEAAACFCRDASAAIARHDSYTFMSHAPAACGSHTTECAPCGGCPCPERAAEHIAARPAPAPAAPQPMQLLPGGLLCTGPTGTNVNDCFIALLSRN